MLPRQNGKGVLLQAIELSSLFSEIAPVALTTYSAHQWDTSLEHFGRMEQLIEGSEALSKRVKQVKRGHGEEAIHTLDGRRVRFRTRTKGGGRGFSGERLILDEAMVLSEMALAALFFTTSAQTDPQVIYAGSAVDQLVHEHGVVLARLRKRALERDDGIVYLEWSAEAEIDELADVIDDPVQRRRANPSKRIRDETIAAERKAVDARTFGVERLGVGDWPPVDAIDKTAIDFELWLSMEDGHSGMLDPIVLAFDVTPDRSRASIGAAGQRADGRFHVEVVDARRGTGWLPERLAELIERHQPQAVVFDPASPANALIGPLNTLGVELTQTTAREYAGACGLFYDLLDQRQLRHLGQHELNVAIRNASQRPLGEAWAWSRRLSAGDISPLVAVTLAVWAAHSSTTSVYEERGLIAV